MISTYRIHCIIPSLHREDMGKAKHVIKWIKNKISRKKKSGRKLIPRGVAFSADSGIYQSHSKLPLRMEELCNVSNEI